MDKRLIRFLKYFTLTTTILFGCAEVNGNFLEGSGSTDTTWGNGGGGPTYSIDGNASSSKDIAEQFFRKIQQQLESKCGGSCHGTGTTLLAPRWLAGPDPYTSIRSYPGIITEDVYSSKLINRPAGHPAATLLDPGNETLLLQTTKWLEMEALVIKTSPLPSTQTVDISMGLIDLSSLGSQMVGAKITFTAQHINGAVKFNDIRVAAPPARDLHVVVPVLVMVPGDGSPSISDSAFSAIDVTIAAGKTKLLPSPFFFFGWKSGSKLRVSFKKIEAIPPAL